VEQDTSPSTIGHLGAVLYPINYLNKNRRSSSLTHPGLYFGSHVASEKWIPVLFSLLDLTFPLCVFFSGGIK